MCTYILYRILGNYRVLDTIMSVNKSVKYLTSVSSKVFFDVCKLRENTHFFRLYCLIFTITLVIQINWENTCVSI